MVVNAPTSNITSAAELAVGLLLATRPQHRPRQRGAQGRRVEAQQVRRRRAARQDGRHRRPRPHRRSRRRAAEGVRGDDRSPTTPTCPRPRPASSAPASWRSTSCSPSRDFITVHLPEDARDVGLIGEEALKQGQADRARSSTPPAVASSTSRRWPTRIARGSGRRRRYRRLRQGADHRRRRCSSSSRSSSRRTSAPRPTRPRRRPASPWPGRCGSPSAATSCPTPSTCPAARSPRRCAPASPWSRSSVASSPPFAGAVPVQLDVDVRGEITAFDVSVWQLAALKGLFTGRRRGAGLLRQRPGARRAAWRRVAAADRRGRRRLPQRHDAARDARPTAPRCRSPARSPGPQMVEKVVGINGFDLEVPLTRPHGRSSPTPTARASSARSVASSATPASTSAACRWPAATARRSALVVLTVDSALPPTSSRAIAEAIGAESFAVVDLDRRPPSPTPRPARAHGLRPAHARPTRPRGRPRAATPGPRPTRPPRPRFLRHV